LASKAVFEAKNGEQNPWSYASAESRKHTEKLSAWLQSCSIGADTPVFVVRGPHDVTELTWSELTRTWTRFFADEDLRIIDRDYSWIVDYRKERIIRFGRLKSSNPALLATAAPQES
jgi:hypothetical protein